MLPIDQYKFLSNIFEDSISNDLDLWIYLTPFLSLKMQHPPVNDLGQFTMQMLSLVLTGNVWIAAEERTCPFIQHNFPGGGRLHPKQCWPKYSIGNKNGQYVLQDTVHISQAFSLIKCLWIQIWPIVVDVWSAAWIIAKLRARICSAALS